MTQPPVDLAFIAHQQRQILDQLATMRDDAGVALAILMRLDGTVSGLVNEIRATHTQANRHARRLDALEKQGQTEA
jgi:hypothetical protein